MPELSITSAIPWVPPTQESARPSQSRTAWNIAKPNHHEAMVYIVMIMNMSRRLARTGDWRPKFPDAH
jgi:hypothetical protein